MWPSKDRGGSRGGYATSFAGQHKAPASASCTRNRRELKGLQDMGHVPSPQIDPLRLAGQPPNREAASTGAAEIERWLLRQGSEVTRLRITPSRST